MCLATCTNNIPSNRYVLLKGHDSRGNDDNNDVDVNNTNTNTNNTNTNTNTNAIRLYMVY